MTFIVQSYFDTLLRYVLSVCIYKHLESAWREFTKSLNQWKPWVCSFRRIQKRIFDLRFARFRGRKEREIRNWICNLGNLSPTRAICTTASQKMTCFLLLTNYAIIPYRIWWSAVRIATMEHIKQTKKEAH